MNILTVTLALTKIQLKRLNPVVFLTVTLEMTDKVMDLELQLSLELIFKISFGLIIAIEIEFQLFA